MKKKKDSNKYTMLIKPGLNLDGIFEWFEDNYPTKKRRKKKIKGGRGNEVSGRVSKVV